MSSDYSTSLKPRFDWALSKSHRWLAPIGNISRDENIQSAIFWSLMSGWILVFAALGGWIAMDIRELALANRDAPEEADRLGAQRQ